MISRRNIRVKVMQLLYIMDSAGDQPIFKDPIQELQKQLDISLDLLVYLIYFTTETARYAEISSQKRASKNLPDYADLNVNIKIAGNDLLWQIMENKSYQRLVESTKADAKCDRALVRKMFEQLTQTAEYKAYVAEPSREKKTEKAIIEFLFNSVLLPNELFESHIEELYNTWDDDGEMMQLLVNNFFAKPLQTINQSVTPEKWLFAKTLLATVLDKDEQLLDIIKPKLNNWDSERIAVLDMVLMKMGLSELMFFETIPPKVTINEYIDLAKDYSTPQSGQFVNGILDSIHKEMVAEGRIHKVDFKSKG